MASNVNVIIQAGGKGTRLRPLTFAIPKPLVPIGEKPILELLLERLNSFGLRTLYLTVGYRAELIETYFGNGKRFGINLFYQREPFPLGTAGPVRNVYDAYGLSGPCLAMNADIITDIDFLDIIKWHNAHNAAMTVATRSHEYKMPFGMLHVQNEYILGVKEKPSIQYNVSAGIYVLDETTVNLIPQATNFDMPELMSLLIAGQKRLIAYPLTASWRAIETVEDLKDAYENGQL